MFLRDNRIRQGLISISRQMNSFGRGIASIGARVGGFAAAAITPLAFAVREASNMEETMNKFNVVFGESSGIVQEWGNQFAAEVGRSKLQIADFLASTQDLLVPIGFDADTATDLSKQITGLAVDLASFNNLADADALNDLQAALTGSGEVMKKYGVIVSEAAVKQELLSQGVDVANATEQQKVFARLSIIMRGTTAAQGDAIRSAGSFANQMKALRGAVSDVAVQVGSALLPAITPVVSGLVDAARWTERWLAENQSLVAGFGRVIAITAAVAAALVVIGVSIVAVGAVIGSLSTIMAAAGAGVAALGSAFAFLLSPIGLAIAAITGVGAAVLSLTGAGAAGIDFLRGAFISLRDDALRAFDGIANALAAGNIAQAGEILWLTLQVEWQRGVAALNNIWQEWKAFFLNVINEATFSAAAFFTDAWAAIQSTWLETIDLLSDGWTVFTNAIARTWESVIGVIAQGVLRVLALFDETIDAAAAAQELGNDLAANNERRQESQDQAILGRQRARQERLERIEADRIAAREALEQQRQAEERAINEGQRSALEGSQQELQAARDRWTEALAAAAEAREQAEANGGAGGAGLPQQIQGILDGISGATGAAIARSSGPSFAGRGLEQIFGGRDQDVARRTLDVAKAQLEEQKKIRQATEQNNLAFGP
jgi:hypothetical protein